MNQTIIQVPSVILPLIPDWLLFTGTETEGIDDLLEHTSVEFEVKHLQEKQIHITAMEVIGVTLTGAIVGGPFTIGEAVVGTVSGAGGVVIGQGATWILVASSVGIFVAGDVVAGVVSGAFINGGLVVVSGVPGNMQCWVELSPYLTTTTNLYWSAIGGGGNFLAPTAPHIEVGTGLSLAVHTIMLPWQIHSEYARLVIQTPIAADLPLSYWGLQAMVCGQGGA